MSKQKKTVGGTPTAIKGAKEEPKQATFIDALKRQRKIDPRFASLQREAATGEGKKK